MYFDHTVSLFLQLKKHFVKKYTDKGPQISLKHGATASKQQGSAIHQLHVFTSGTRTLSTAPRAIASTPLNRSCSRGGKQRTLCTCINRIKQVRERSFSKSICNNKLVFPLSYFIHKVSTSRTLKSISSPKKYILKLRVSHTAKLRLAHLKNTDLHKAF